MPSCSDENTLSVTAALKAGPAVFCLEAGSAHTSMCTHLTAHDCACAEEKEPGSKLEFADFQKSEKNSE